MPCKRCMARGKTWEGDDPRCAFEHSDRAAHNNWRCATIDALWDLAEARDSTQYGEDCTAALIPLYDDADGRFIVLSRYKMRGNTDCAKVITDDGDTTYLPLQTAELVLDRAEAREAREKELLRPSVSYANQIPAGVAQAQSWLNYVRHTNYKLDQMEEDAFMATWCAVVYLNPTLHPDDCDQWPADIQAVAVEAFRRRNIGELTDDELYPSEAIHARLKKEARNGCKL